MQEFVLYCADQATLHGLMQAMGFTDFQGALPDGSGDYFLNEVGVVYQPTGETESDPWGVTAPVMAPTPGWWARLRINGNNPFASGALQIPDSITVYPPGPDQPAIGFIA